ncbi:MAG: flagellar hook-basal body complex protein [Planctomycetota bacterium]|nr:flagellar hook-basal body complex protein [Planctomycetota bacterium]
MPNSFFAAVSGLLAHQRRLDIVANNLANQNTTAFKASRGVFADLIYETVQNASTGNGLTVGGTNPSQLGSGVKVSQIKKLFSQGNLEATGQPLDFALDGEGFFVVGSGDSTLFTRAGSFSLDANNYLVDPSTGAYVQRFGTLGESGQAGGLNFQAPNDPRIQIPIGAVIPGQPTVDVSLDGILNAEAVGPLAQTLTSSTPYTTGGAAAATATLLNNLDSMVTPYVGGDSLDITGTSSDGTPFSSNFAVDATTTLGDVVTHINGLVTGGTVSLDAAGNMLVTADAVGPSQLSLNIEDAAGNTGSMIHGNHRLQESQVGKLGDTFSGVFDLFDAQGRAHGLNFEFQKMGSNLWDLTLSMDPADGSIVGGNLTNILFNDDGTMHSSVDTDVTITANFTGISSPQAIDLSFGSIRQLATEFEIQPSQDGFAPSELVSTSVDTDGVIQGLTANGQVLSIARLAVATFSNKHSLNAVGSNYFANTLNSGNPQVGSALTAGRGAILGGQLESSNVDAAYEFTQLIVAQRGFSANARTISVADEVLEELTNIIR